jgi:hypothetical protein
MLNSGKKFAHCATKKINILILVLTKKKFLNETKNHKTPLQVKWSFPKFFLYIDQHPGNNCVLIIKLFTNRHVSVIKKITTVFLFQLLQFDYEV